MLLWLFRTKERIIITVFVGVITIIGTILIIQHAEDRYHMDHAVMAENYLKAGNFEMAVKAYQSALLAEGADNQFLSAGLADAYVGMNEYEKALEVLRICYQATSGSIVKEKIEEVTEKKLEYDYIDATSRAEIYYSNQEYDKAIAEYEKAKKIKSKEATPYIRISQAYMEDGNYDLAREEAIEGQEITKEEVFDEILEDIALCVKKEQYDKLVKQAQEYINQENYKDGILTYQKGIKLLPAESAAYQGLAEVYLLQENYDKAIALLRYAKMKARSDELDRLMKKAEQLKELEEG